MLVAPRSRRQIQNASHYFQCPFDTDGAKAVIDSPALVDLVDNLVSILVGEIPDGPWWS